MLRLDPFSESILFQCDRCRRVGELSTDLSVEEGTVLCWHCLEGIRKDERRASEARRSVYAFK